MRNTLDSAKIEADLAWLPNSIIEHYFVNANAHLDVDDKTVGLDPEVSQLESITQFLTLPTITARTNPRKRDLLVNFAKSIILTSDQYIQAMEQLKTTREEAALEKERTRQEKVESRKRKLAYHEQANAERALSREHA
jgi:hypothetical protein